MTFDELEWSVAGCCGEHRIARIRIGDVTRVVYDDSGYGFRTFQVNADGILQGTPVVVDRAALDAMLDEAGRPAIAPPAA